MPRRTRRFADRTGNNKMSPRSVADVEGPWDESEEFVSGLIDRCKRHWYVPIVELSNEVLATYLRQRIGLRLTIPEARRRVAGRITDDTELYEGELAAALERVEQT